MKRSLAALIWLAAAPWGCAGPSPALGPSVPEYRAGSVTVTRMESPARGAATVPPEVLALFEGRLRRELDARGFRRGGDLTIRYRVREYATGRGGPPRAGAGRQSAGARLWVEALYVARDGRALSMVTFRQRPEAGVPPGEELISRAAAHIARNAQHRFQ